MNDNGYCTIGIYNRRLIGALYNITLILGIDASLKLDAKPGRLSGEDSFQVLNIHPDGFKARGPGNGGRQAVHVEGANSYAALAKLERVPGEHLVWEHPGRGGRELQPLPGSWSTTAT